MGKLELLAKRLKEVPREQYEKALLKIIHKYERAILEMNKGQLLFGEDSTGKSLGKYSSESYAKYKKKLNPLGVVDLKLTGTFWDLFVLLANEFPIEVDSLDEKRNLLVSKYGKDIFGINQQNMEILRDILREDIIEYYKKHMLLR